jgi:hypothetical protein
MQPTADERGADHSHDGELTPTTADTPSAVLVHAGSTAAEPSPRTVGKPLPIVKLIPAARLRRERPLWTLVGLLLGLAAGGCVLVVVVLHQPAVLARVHIHVPAALPLPGARSTPAQPAAHSSPPAAPPTALASRSQPSDHPAASPVPSAAVPASAPATTPTPMQSQAPSPTATGAPPPPSTGVLYQGSGQLNGSACVPADCSGLVSASGHVRYDLGHTSCAPSTVITLTLSSSSANRSSFTVSDSGSAGRISGQAAPFHVTGPFFVQLRTTSSCAYDLTISG